MLAIASNITTRNRKVAEAMKPRPAECASPKAAERINKERTEFLQSLAKQCVAAGADILDINLQQQYDQPEIMEFAVETIQDAVDIQLCLSTNKPETLKAGLRACRRPPIVNYVSLDTERLGEILPVAARYEAEIVLLVSDPITTVGLEDTLKTAAVLIGTANEAGIPDEHIILDPNVLHVTSDIGQRHTKSILELIPALSETFDGKFRTTCWINNVSAGAPRRLRPLINNTFLSILAGVGLSSAFLDVLNKDTMRIVRLMRIFKDEVIYSDRYIER